MPGPRLQTGIDQAIHAAARRAGLTLQEAYRRADIAYPSVMKWRRGGRADRVNLERFAEVLHAPELIDLIPQHQVTLICRWCPGRKDSPPWYFRRQQKIGNYQNAEIDWDLRKGTFICANCLAAERAAKNGNVPPANVALMRKKGGRRQVREWFLKVRQDGPLPNLSGRKQSPEAIWRRSISRIRLVPTGQWGTCRIRDCGYLLHNPQNQPKGPVAAHSSCLYARPMSPRDAGRLPGYAGQHLSPAKIAAAFALAVAHLVRGVDIGGSCEQGGRGLAVWFGLEERTVRNRINRLLELLPPDDRGDEQVTFWARALRWAKCNRQLQRWGKENGWPWRRVLYQLRHLQ